MRRIGRRIGILVTLAVVVMCIGCTRKIYIPTETIKTERDTIYEKSVMVQRDTIREYKEIERIVRDSISPRLDTLGNVTGYDYWHYEVNNDKSDRFESQLQQAVDSLLKAHDASEVQIITEEKIIEKDLSVWQKIQIILGDILLAVIIIVALYFGIKRYIKSRLR